MKSNRFSCCGVFRSNTHKANCPIHPERCENCKEPLYLGHNEHCPNTPGLTENEKKIRESQFKIGRGMRITAPLHYVYDEAANPSLKLGFKTAE